MAGRSPQVRKVLQLARRIAVHNMPVLLVGETGTGKELLAHEIHRWSGRRGRIQDINCGSLPAGMVESLLFGHRKGSFTGAVRAASGLIKGAGGGTLFLDELTSLPVEAQVKLLRVLETGQVRPLGGSSDHRVDFRLIAAVQEDIWVRLEEDQFRQDLYQRVAGMVLTLPPLRDRPEDIVVLAHHFAEKDGSVLGNGTEAVLLNYSWPGNVRELRHAVQRAVVLSDGLKLTVEALSWAIEAGAPPELSGAARGYLNERDFLLATCRENDWSAGMIAMALGISRSTVFRRLKGAGISIRRSGGRGGRSKVSS
ncbi:MAG: sigma 54-interacting transcriptional regulator [Gemmatimonadales bacterium]